MILAKINQTQKQGDLVLGIFRAGLEKDIYSGRKQE